MITAAIYNTNSGEITKIITGKEEVVLINIQEGEEFYLNCPAWATHIINNEPVTIIPEVVPPTLEEVKTAKLIDLAAARYKEEVSGIAIGEVTIKTDRESQAQLNNAFTSLKNGLIPDTDWKGVDGWTVPLTLADIEPIASTVALFVRSLFKKEHDYADQIEAISSNTSLTDEDKIAQITSIVWS